MATSWTVAAAKARFSEVLDRAGREGPQTVTRNGRPTAVIVGVDEWERRTRRTGTLAEFFASSPLKDSGLQTTRRTDRARKVRL